MKNTSFTPGFVKALSLIGLCLAAFAFTPKAGLDSYEIYLNDRLLLKHYVNQPLNLGMLQLEKDNAHQQLNMHFTANELPKGEMLASFRLD